MNYADKEQVYIENRDPEQEQVTFHRETTEQVMGKFVDKTVCGRTSRFNHSALRLPRVWAAKFAVACVECFTEGGG